jgi:uncharacterized OsmC-like protein
MLIAQAAARNGQSYIPSKNGLEYSGDGCKIRSTGKDFQIGGQTIERGRPFTLVSDFRAEFRGRSDGPTFCEMCMASIGSCISQTIVAYATMMGIYS